MEKIDIKSYSEAELLEYMTALGQPKFRTAQLFKWLQQGVEDFDEMTNLPKSLREELKEKCYIANVSIIKKLVSKIDGTVKYVYELYDGERIESVVMKYEHGYTVCISTQVGCRMGCSFCASGIDGLFRNLTPSEMLAQITKAQQDNGIRISNVVMMGMGEPLDNFEAVTRFLEMLNTPCGVHIGMRHVSLSTCGLVDKIYQLMEQKWQLTLSVSLHAPNNELRSRIMPINRKWPVETLIKACKEYSEVTGRRISFEYAMIDGVNDSDASALELAKLLRGMLCHVNLIPANEVNGKGHRRSSRERLRSFQQVLLNNGINATVRRTLGSDINASCGQLRREADKTLGEKG